MQGLYTRRRSSSLPGILYLRVYHYIDVEAFPQEFIFEVSGGTYHLKETVPGAKTMVPPACSFTA